MNTPRSELSLETEQPGGCARETFVIVRTTDTSIPVHQACQDVGLSIRRLDGGAFRSNADRKVRRILIFDNHPDTLRVVFERHAKEFAVHVLQGRVTWNLRLLWILAIDLLVKMPSSLWRLIW